MSAEDKGSIILRGPDADELAAVLRWPELPDGSYGFDDLPRAAIALRELSARRAIGKLELDVVLEIDGT
ncbi:MAG: hypothetical protein KC621_25375 [Myxococcales bacterium]|nr:hypothetical protein [Myxococcales bacterium]